MKAGHAFSQTLTVGVASGMLAEASVGTGSETDSEVGAGHPGSENDGKPPPKENGDEPRPGNPEGRPPGNPEGRPVGRPEGRPPGNPEGIPPGNAENGSNPPEGRAKGADSEGRPLSAGNGSEPGKPVGMGKSSLSVPVGRPPSGPKGRPLGRAKLNDPAVPVGMGKENPGKPDGMGKVESASSLGTATGSADTIAMALERATRRMERMFAGAMGGSLVAEERCKGQHVYLRVWRTVNWVGEWEADVYTLYTRSRYESIYITSSRKRWDPVMTCTYFIVAEAIAIVSAEPRRLG